MVVSDLRLNGFKQEKNSINFCFFAEIIVFYYDA